VQVIRHKLAGRAKEEEVSRAALEEDRETLGIWRAVAGRAQVGRPNLSPSASEDKPWLAPRLRALPDVIGPLHRKAEIHSGYRQSATPQPVSIQHSMAAIRFLSGSNRFLKRCCQPAGAFDVCKPTFHRAAINNIESAPLPS
jgi:hypothetical protein